MIKFKPKQLLKRLATSAVALITAASLAVQSFALDELGDGDPTGEGVYGTYLYGYGGTRNFIWMVEAYVSTTADGKIDTARESLGGNNDGQLARIGSILFLNGNMSNTILPYETTTNKRNVTELSDIYSKEDGQVYLPESTASVTPSNPFYTRSVHGTYIGEGDTSYYVTTESCGLPKMVESSTFNYNRDVKAVIESPEFDELIVDNLAEAMGGNNGGIYAALGSAVNSSVSNKVDARRKALLSSMSEEDATNEALSHLFPTSDDPYVQWAVVVTPMMLIRASSSYTKTAHWMISQDSSTGKLNIIQVDSNHNYHIYYAMDAWTAAVYNKISLIIANDMRKTAIDAGVPEIFFTGFYNGAYKTSSVPTNGALRAVLGTDNYPNIFTPAHIDPDRYPEHLLGIRSCTTQNLTDKAQNGDHWQYLSQRGGITIALSKEPESSDPTVYHHVYNIKLKIPNNAPNFVYEDTNGTKYEFVMNAANALSILKGEFPDNIYAEGSPMFAVSLVTEAIKYYQELNFDFVNQFCQYCLDNDYIARDNVDISIGDGVWEDIYSYVPDKTAANSGYKTDENGDLCYYATEGFRKISHFDTIRKNSVTMRIFNHVLEDFDTTVR